MPRADRHALEVENGSNIMRVHVSDVERNDPRLAVEHRRIATVKLDEGQFS